MGLFHSAARRGEFHPAERTFGEGTGCAARPLGPVGENFIQTYQTRWGVVQFHLGLPGVPRFDEAERAGVTRKMEQGTPVKCLSGIHLLAAKQAANRPQDQADIEFLKELQRLGKLC